MVAMSRPDAEPEPTPAVTGPTAAPETAEPPPLTRLGERFRIPLGILVALLGAALAVVFAIRPLDEVDGGRGVVERIAGVLLWVGVGAAGATWAIGAPRRVTNICALAGIAAYLVMLVSGI